MKKQLIGLFLSLFCFISTTWATPQLVFAVDLIRHGDRTPIMDFPKSTFDWKEGFGQLTAIGMNQEYQLGQRLRKRYVEETHLLPPNYSPRYMYVRSTDMDRTIMSAQSLLLGLYPMGTGPNFDESKRGLPEAYQPIPVHTIPQRQDKLLNAHLTKNFFTMGMQFFLTNKKWLEVKYQNSHKLNIWSQETGLDINNLNKLILLGDNLYIRRSHNLPLPPGMSNEEADEVISLAMNTIVTQLQNKEFTHAMGKMFLKQMAKYFENVVQQKTAVRYILLSAHDSSIMCVMNTLDAPLNSLPPYASHLNFSLYNDNNNYFVQATYNEKVIPIPGCQNGLCTLKQFMQFVKSA